MKKIICLLLVLTFALGLSSCGKSTGNTDIAETSGKDQTSSSVVAGSTIMDESDIKVVYTGIEFTDESDEKIYAQLSFDITNNRDEDVFFRITNMCINGIMNIGNTYLIVRAGSQITEPLSIWREEIEFFNTEKFATITMDISVTSSSGLNLFKEDMGLKTTDPDYVQSYEFDGEVVVDNDYITVYYIKKSGDQYKSYCDMVIYNKSDLTLRITPYNARVNDNYVASFMERAVVALKPATYTFTYISVNNDDISELGVEEITDMKYQLDIFDNKEYDETGTNENVPILTTEDIVIK